MKELLQELIKNELVLGLFYFKGEENLFSFTEKYSVPESRIKRIALVLTQTMDALGAMVFDSFLLEGENKRVSIFKYNDGYCGIIFPKNIAFSSIESIYQKVISTFVGAGLKAKEEVKVKPSVKVLEKEERILSSSIFEKIKEILSEYLGDFSETIFENQMSDMKIATGSATFSKVQKLCFSLQKASAMLIGPSFAREMVDKLLSVIRDEE